MKPSLYFAAALFNAKETMFNSYIVYGLEAIGYQINFPQRDGFDFVNLSGAFSKKITPDRLDLAVKTTIYCLDIGILIPDSDIVLANFDEPLDDGVIVETSYARLMGKPVIGYRTDLRSPYGNLLGAFNGMHAFPGFQAKQFIFEQISAKTPKDRDSEISLLVQKISDAIDDSEVSSKNHLYDNPIYQNIVRDADILFDGIKDYNLELDKIAQRYISNQKTLEKILPQFI